jgi:hypothetical protein
VIYRPPPSRTNKLKNTTLFEEWTEFLDRLFVIPDELLITGDLNFHLDNVNRSQIDIDSFFTDLALSEMREIISMALLILIRGIFRRFDETRINVSWVLSFGLG